MRANTLFNIYVMSYMRPTQILSQKHFEYCTYVVRESEADAYRENGVKNILPIPTGAVHDFMSTLYWIIENTPERVIFVADDDIVRFMYRTDDVRDITTDNDEPDVETITAEIERIGQLIYDLNIGLAFDQPNLALYCYTQEFAFKGMAGHMRWINKDALKATYDSDDPASSDIDMVMQELLRNRIVLQPKYFCVRAFMDTNDGAYTTRQKHYDLIESMKNKWGKYYDYNYKRNIARIKVAR